MKDYKKILEGVVNIINTTEKSDIGFANICTYIGENCPELKENNGERIRKALIEMVHDTTGDSLWVDYNVHKEDALAWLEKQGEQNLANSAKTCKVEQKFNPCDGYVNRRGCINCENGELRETEQKSTAWSEEDENGLGYALWAIKQARNIAKDENDMGNLWYAEHWLKSIKGRVQPKQEWSEEDKSLCSQIQGILSVCKSEDLLSSDLHKEMCDWLKSLKPQNHWKPSDKQMEAVRIAAEIGTANNSWAMDVLKSMYQDLKKLRK